MDILIFKLKKPTYFSGMINFVPGHDVKLFKTFLSHHNIEEDIYVRHRMRSIDMSIGTESDTGSITTSAYSSSVASSESSMSRSWMRNQFKPQMSKPAFITSSFSDLY